VDTYPVGGTNFVTGLLLRFTVVTVFLDVTILTVSLFFNGLSTSFCTYEGMGSFLNKSKLNNTAIPIAIPIPTLTISIPSFFIYLSLF